MNLTSSQRLPTKYFSSSDSCHLKNPKSCIQTKSLLYQTISAVFHVALMTISYLVVRSAISLHHWLHLPSSLSRTHLKVISYNIANLKTLQACLYSAWCPYSKENYQHLGRNDGLRITHDIIFQPANGLCLGQSLNFLSQYLGSTKKVDQDKLIDAAKAIDEVSNRKSIELQGLYKALLGIEGAIDPKEKLFFTKFLKEGVVSSRKTSYPKLLVALESFLISEDHSRPLRNVVLDDLEKQEIDITPDLYALILELDSIWHFERHPNTQKNSLTHLAITNAVAGCVELKITSQAQINGDTLFARNQLNHLNLGNYLIQFPNHTIALVKSHDHLGLFDSNAGMAILTNDHQQTSLLQLLEHYGSHHTVALKVLKLEQLILS